MIETKICSKCLTEQNIDQFRVRSGGKRRNECRTCLKLHSKLWYQNNIDKVKEFNLNPEQKKKRNALIREKYKKNPAFKSRLRESNKALIRTPEYKAARRRYIAKWKSIPKNRLTCVLRGRIHTAIKSGGRKSINSEKLLGCSFEQCRAHLEQQFATGMTWENYGEWHIDHIIPCAHFDLSDALQQKICFHYLNFQPLWAKDNISKGDTIFPELYCRTLAAIKRQLSLN